MNMPTPRRPAPSRDWLTDPSPAGLLLLLTLCALLTAAAVVAVPARGDDQAGAGAGVERALAWWVERAPRHPLRRPEYRAEVARELVAGAARHDLPVELLAAILLRESSGRPGVLGPAGEAGLMQVHPDTAARFRCHLGTPRGDIECGCRVLSHHRVRCGGDLRGALAAYGSRSGSCHPPAGRAVSRMVADRFRLSDRLLKITIEKTPPSP